MSDTYILVELRRLVADRARQSYEYCRSQARYSADPFTIDHVKPRSLNGPTTAENLAFSCHGCNQHKSTRTMVKDTATDSLVPLFNPREHFWEGHFSWNEDFTLMIGLTPIGRATITALHLNHPGLVNLRRVLYAIGEHPPKPIQES